MRKTVMNMQYSRAGRQVGDAIVDESSLTLEQLAVVAHVDVEWINSHLRDGLFPLAEARAGDGWQFSAACLVRARRMRALERDFDAVPELAALVADLLEELDSLRSGEGHR